MTDPYKSAEAAYAEAAAKLGATSPHAVRSAVTAALIAERKRTWCYQITRFRQRWFLWIGGWERANCGGWQIRHEWGWAEPTPVTVLRAITFYGWGLQVRLPSTIFVWTWRGDRGMYFSPDGTPNKATRWLRRPKWLSRA